MKIKSVKALSNFRLEIVFDDHVSGVIDLATFIQSGIFSPLMDENLFDKVYTNGYSVSWSDQLEIDSLKIYSEILNKNPLEIANNSSTNGR